MKTHLQQHLLPYGLAVAGLIGLTLPAFAQSTTRVSVDSLGVEGNSGSSSPSISADGRYVAFHSSASNLVPGDTNGRFDVFVHDRQTGQTTRVSVDSAGTQGNDNSTTSCISADGRYVVFSSGASNLVPGDTNGRFDVFVHDRQTGQTTRVSVDSAGTQGNDSSTTSCISADGRYVVFSSGASNLVPGDTNGRFDVFVHDRQTSQTTRVSVNSAGTQGNHDSGDSSISAHGRYIAFESLAANLVVGDTNFRKDVFIHDRQTGQTSRVSVDSLGIEGNLDSENPSISADGLYVAFVSDASNLVVGDTNGKRDVFVYDRQAGQTTRASKDSFGMEANDASFDPSISADGHYVAFDSRASNLVPGDTNGSSDIFVHDRQTGQTTRVSVDSRGHQGSDYSYGTFISAGGRYVAFVSDASNLVPGDLNNRADVFVMDRLGPTLTKTGACPGSTTFTASGVRRGSTVAFLWGTAGTFAIPPGNPCAGVQLDLVPFLAPPPGYALKAVWDAAVVDFNAFVPAGACGMDGRIQALDLTTCATTNTMSF